MPHEVRVIKQPASSPRAEEVFPPTRRETLSRADSFWKWARGARLSLKYLTLMDTDSPMVVAWRAVGRTPIHDHPVQQGLHEEALLRDELDSKCKVFVCATSEKITKTVTLTSYQSKRWPDDLLNSVKIWEAGRATAAATTYFEPIEVGPFSERFVDGALGANNPVWVVWDEAANIWKEDGPLEANLKCLVSIGTGMPSLKPFDRNLINIGKGLLAIATETETTAERFLRHHSMLDDEHRYYRFNVLKGLEDIGLEDSNSFSSIMAATREYLSMEKVRKEISRCGEILETRGWQRRFNEAVTAATEEATRTLQQLQIRASESQAREGEIIDWLLELPEYQSWLSSSSATILWHPGLPGSGKTTLVTALITQYRRSEDRESERIAFYFCEPCPDIEAHSVFRPEIGGGNVAVQVTILQSIIAQLLSHDQNQLHRYTQASENEYRLLLGAFGLKWRGTKADLLSGLWELLWLILQRSLDLKILVIIDGIDKLPLETRQGFLMSLCKYVRNHNIASVRFFITSRPYQDIEQALKGFTIIDLARERKNCLTSLFFTEWRSRRVDVAACVKGTFQWIWEHKSYRKWRDQGSGILWIQGKPGSGKSTLAKMIQQQFTEARLRCSKEAPIISDPSPASISVIVDFFYSSRKGSVATSHEKMLRSLLYQILDQDPSLYKCFREIFRALRDQSRTLVEWPLPKLKDVFRRIVEEGSKTSREICCVLDAMDESEDGKDTGTSRQQMVRFFSEIMEAKYQGLKIILTSRPANEIEGALKCFHQIDLEKHNSVDISLIVGAGLQEMRTLIQDMTQRGTSFDDSPTDMEIAEDFSLPSQPDRQEDELGFIAESLQKNADGVILWVVLVLGELCNSLSRGFYTLREIKEKAANVPLGLEQVYMDIVKSQAERLSVRQIEIAQMMLMWTCFSTRTLYLEEFRDAVAITINWRGPLENAEEELNDNRVQVRGDDWAPMRRQMVEYCAGFLDVVSSTQPESPHGGELRAVRRRVRATDIVQLVHHSAKEFLIRRLPSSPFAMEAQFAKHVMARGCVRYLAASVPLNALKMKPVGQWIRRDYLKFLRHLEERPLLLYAMDFFRTPGEAALIEELISYTDSLKSNPGLHGVALLEPWIGQIGFSSRGVHNQGIASFRKQCFIAAIEEGLTTAFRSILSVIVNDQTTVSSGLNEAIERGHVTIAKLLIERVAGDNPQSLQQALNRAAKKSDLLTLDRILNTGLVPAGLGFEGTTALHWAARRGDMKIANSLIKAGADPRAVSSELRLTPLDEAVRQGHKDMTRFLLSNGADKPSLHEAAFQNKILAEILLENEDNIADLEAHEESPHFDYHERQLPLHISIVNDNIETASVFLRNGANINAGGVFERTPLHQAVQWSSLETIEFLLERGAKADVQDEWGRTPLIEASTFGKVEYVEILLKYHASLDIRDSAHRTALHEATTHGHEDIVALLLARGAGRFQEDFWGMTPANIAERDGNERLIRLLKSPRWL